MGEAMMPPAVMWIDPGGMTGIAVLTRRFGFWADEFAFQEAGATIQQWCTGWSQALAVGYERFTIGPQTHKLTRQPEAMEMIGVARWFATACGCQVLKPAQQHTPDAIDRQRLEAIGWWTPGKDDAQSAACHLLKWLMTTGNLPNREAGILAAQRAI
jgi:hypothetical protein